MNPKDKSQDARAKENGQALFALLNGYQNTALVYVAAKLGLADLLAGGSRESSDLARSVGAHPSALHRILRALVVLGVCREDDDGRFSMSSSGVLLRADAPGSLRAMAIICGEEYLGAWGGLLHSVLTGEKAFDRVFGMSQWEHREMHPELSEQFNSDLAQETARAGAAIVAAYDFSQFGAIADVGGGQGALLAAILNACPKTSGILLDTPHVIEKAHRYLEGEGVAARCRCVSGDFFAGVPDGADVHVLKSVIHDWDDEKSLVILANCRAALNAEGRLLLVERVMPERAADDPSTILVDVQMLAITGGRERTEAEYRALLSAAGFRLTKIIPTAAPFKIIEGVRAE